MGSRRAYATALLRWLRFLNAIEVDWVSATTTDYADFIVWMRTVASPRRGGANRVAKRGYASRSINLTCSTLADFYDYHARQGSGPRINPIYDPHVAGVGGMLMRKGRARRRALGRQKTPKASPRSIPDAAYDELFVSLRNDRDRAMVALYVSTGARAEELLGLTGADLDFGNNRITVTRKGGAVQVLPASADAMLWLRRYLGATRIRADEKIWRGLRAPHRPLTYAAIRMAFTRAQEALGTKYTLHQLRHTAAYRMLQDPQMTLADIQWMLGHAHIESTEIYTSAHPKEVLEKMAAHQRAPRYHPIAADDGRYKSESMRTLFGFDE